MTKTKPRKILTPFRLSKERLLTRALSRSLLKGRYPRNAPLPENGRLHEDDPAEEDRGPNVRTPERDQ